MVAAQMGSLASKSDIDNLYYALVSNLYLLMLKLCRINQMLIKSIYRALIVLGVAILMASVTVTAAQPSKNAAPEAKKTPTPTPEALWVLNAVGRSDISIFPGKRLSKNTGTIASGGISVTVDGATLDALAFNASGNLWLSFCSGQNASGFVIELSAAELRHLATTGRGKLTNVIQDPAASTTGVPEYLTCPQNLGFDNEGNLWTETEGGTSTAESPVLLEYTSEQLEPGKSLVQSPDPTIAIETGAIQTDIDPALTFDKEGNLWLSGGVISTGNSGDEQQTIVEYTTLQLASGTPTNPNQTLIVADTSSAGALNAPSSITFDVSGNLWVAFALGGSGGAGGVEMIASGDLAGTGTSTPSPAVTLGSATFIDTKSFGTLASFANPYGLAFDNVGNLWVANHSRQADQASKIGDGSIVEFTPSELTNGSPVPIRGILATKKDANLGQPLYMTYGPAFP
jgi:hypothetical protein